MTRQRDPRPLLAAVYPALALLIGSLASGCGDDPASPGTQLLSREDGPSHSLALCQDEVDNDGDGLFDCDDPDCAAFFACSGATPDASDASDSSDSSDSSDASEDATVGDADAVADDTIDTIDTIEATDIVGHSCLEHADCDPVHGIFCVDGACRMPADYTVAPSPSAYASMGMVLGAGLPDEPAGQGAVIGSFCGVEARRNAPAVDGSFDDGQFGWIYQSPELAARYLCARSGSMAACPVEHLRADAWWDARSALGIGELTRFPSGGEVPPRAGDVLAFDVAPMGHLAIVTRVLLSDDVGLVEVIEQGLAESSHAYALTIDAGRYSVASAHGWLRPVDDIEGCGVSGHITSLAVMPTPPLAGTGPAGTATADGQLLALDVTARVVGGVAAVDLLLPSRQALFHRDLSGALEDELHLTVTVPLPALPAGEHRLSLEISGSSDAPRTRRGAAVDSLALRVGPTGDPLPAAFAAASAEFGVPACLLRALADVSTRWEQGRTTRDVVGVMGIRRVDLADAAALISAPSPDALAAIDAGELNVRAAAALMASWADGEPGLAFEARGAVEAWWPVVGRFLGPGVDGDHATSNAVFRVYDRLARGVPGRVPRVAGLDLSALGGVTSRPATPAELLAGDVTIEDAALLPTTGPLRMRIFVPGAAMPRHLCAGACTDDACEDAPVCEPEAALTCVEGAPTWVDSCGEAGDPAPACVPDEDPCTLDLCVIDGCAHPAAPDGTECGPNDEFHSNICSAGVCQSKTDADGDGFYLDAEPFDCPGHDNDALIYPGAPELYDIRDNDCDGKSDDQGLTLLTRYKRVWAENDWEHRYSATPLDPPWVAQPERWIGLYPLDLCEEGPYQPADGCCASPSVGSVIIDLWTGADTPCAEVNGAAVGFTLVALAQCSGAFANGRHYSLLLPEDSGEYTDYSQLATFHCERIGYIPGPAAAFSMPSAVQLFRMRSGAVSDNQWTAAPADEDSAIYDRSDPSITVPVAH